MSVGKGIGIGAGIAMGGCGVLVLLVGVGWWIMSAARSEVARLEVEQVEQLIKDHKAEAGMTEDQVRRALGEPKMIDRSKADYDRWLYPGHKPLQMKGGKVWLVEP